MIDKVAIWVACGSLAVSIVSAVLARKAMQQAKKAATLEPRTKAIEHMRRALFDINNNGLITRNTVNSIRDAMHLAALVFGRDVRKALAQAHSEAPRLNMQSQERKDQEIQDTRALGPKLQQLIDRMN
jgi:K+-sensing histidine kinase KdpD